MAVNRASAIGALANKFQQSPEQTGIRGLDNTSITASPAAPSTPTTMKMTGNGLSQEIHPQNGFSHQNGINGTNSHQNTSINSKSSLTHGEDTSPFAKSSVTSNKNPSVATPISSPTSSKQQKLQSSTIPSTIGGSPLIDLFQGIYTTHFINRHEAAANNFEVECNKSKERVRSELNRLRKELNEPPYTSVTLPTTQTQSTMPSLSSSSQSMAVSGSELQWGLIQLIQQREIEAAKELCQGGRTISSLLEKNTETILNAFAEKTALSIQKSSSPTSSIKQVKPCVTFTTTTPSAPMTAIISSSPSPSVPSLKAGSTSIPILMSILPSTSASSVSSSPSSSGSLSPPLLNQPQLSPRSTSTRAVITRPVITTQRKKTLSDASFKR